MFDKVLFMRIITVAFVFVLIGSAMPPPSMAMINVLKNPGFESGPSNWVDNSCIMSEPSHARSGSWFASLGVLSFATDFLYQDVTIPSDATESYVQFWYQINTDDEILFEASDTMTVEIRDPNNAILLETLVMFSNLDATSQWMQSAQYDLTAFRGQTIRLYFSAMTDGFSWTAFLVDDVVVMAETDGISDRVNILFPNGAEVLPTGSTYTVQWLAPLEAMMFKLKYSLNNGSTWKTVTKTAAGRSYLWDVPVLKSNKNKCRIKIIGYTELGKKVATDTSDAPFSIEIVKLTSPHGKEILTKIRRHTITWVTNETLNPVDSVILKYSKNGGKT